MLATLIPQIKTCSKPNLKKMANVVNNLFKSVLKQNLVFQQIRFYPRWSHRHPKRVYTAEEYENMEKPCEKQPNTSQPEKTPDKTIFDKYGGAKVNWTKPLKQTDDIKYNIKHPKVKKPLTATHQKTGGEANTDMLETVIDAEGNYIYTKLPNNDKIVGIILAEVKSKKEKKKKDLILLEGKRLIREALESGCSLKYILFSRKDEVDYLQPFLPKMGAKLYKMPYREMQMWSDLTTTPGIMAIFQAPSVEDYKPKNCLPFTVICDNIREPGNLGMVLRICAAVGCDRVLLSKGCVDIWDTKVLRGAAGAHFKLQMHKNLDWGAIQQQIDDNARVFIADNNTVSGNEETLARIVEQVPILPYYSADFKSVKHSVLIIGGETLGVSEDSYNLALRTGGIRLNIPLGNGVDSLNVGAALGVIAFELKRQLIVDN